MASASSTLRVVPPKPLPPTEEGVVTLELSGPEARTLQAILQRIGGVPNDTARGYADTIQYALTRAGVRSPFRFDTLELKGSLEFSLNSKQTVEKPNG